MSDSGQQQLGNTLWTIADQLRGTHNFGDFHADIAPCLFLPNLSGNDEITADTALHSEDPKLTVDNDLVP